MANAFHGEVKASLNGTNYTLVINMNTLIEFMDAVGLSTFEELEKIDIAKLSLRDMRSLVWACLVQRHPDATQALAGEIFSADPGILAQLDLVMNGPGAEDAGKPLAPAQRARKKR